MRRWRSNGRSDLDWQRARGGWVVARLTKAEERGEDVCVCNRARRYGTRRQRAAVEKTSTSPPGQWCWACHRLCGPRSSFSGPQDQCGHPDMTIPMQIPRTPAPDPGGREDGAWWDVALLRARAARLIAPRASRPRRSVLAAAACPTLPLPRPAPVVAVAVAVVVT